LRRELTDVVNKLLRDSEQSGTIHIDEVGAAIGVLSVSTQEIEAVVNALEAKGRKINSPSGGKGEVWLGKVLSSARALRLLHGRRPSTSEIALHAGLSTSEVRHALALATIIQR